MIATGVCRRGTQPYINLPMPWSVDPLVQGFHESSVYGVERRTGSQGVLLGDEFFAARSPNAGYRYVGGDDGDD